MAADTSVAFFLFKHILKRGNMSRERLSCSCCSKSDLDTKREKTVLQPGNGFIHLCPVCESMVANPMQDILFFMDKVGNKVAKVSATIDLVFYNIKTDRYIDYKSMRSLEISSEDDLFFTRAEVSKFIKKGGTYRHGDVTYNEANKIALVLREDSNIFLSFLHRNTTEWDVALTFGSNTEAVMYAKQTEDVNEDLWEPISCDITVHGSKVPVV